MNRPSKSLAGVLGAVLLLGSVAAGCGQRGGADGTATPNPPAVSPVASAADGTTAPDANLSMAPEPSTEPADAASPTPTDPPQTNQTADPVDTDLQNIGQLLNGIDSSISGSSSGGGE